MSEASAVIGDVAMWDGEGTTSVPVVARAALAPVPHGKPFTDKLLQIAFDRVCDPWDWRAPIWAEIPVAERELVELAVLRRTGSQPVFAEVPGRPDRLAVFAAGARLAPVVGPDVDVFSTRPGMTMRSWDPNNRWTLLHDLVDRTIVPGRAGGAHDQPTAAASDAAMASDGGTG